MTLLPVKVEEKVKRRVSVRESPEPWAEEPVPWTVHCLFCTVAVDPRIRAAERPESVSPSLTRKRTPAGWE